MDLRRFCTGRRMSGLPLGSAAVIFLTGVLSLTVLPYHIYTEGAGVAWIYAGVFVILQIAYGALSFRLMRYARKNQGMYTVPSYFMARFGLSQPFRFVIAVFYIVIMLIIYSCILSGFAQIISGFDVGNYTICVIIVSSIGLLAVACFGFSLLAKAAVPAVIILSLTLCGIVANSVAKMGLGTIVRNTIWSDIQGSVSDYINVMMKGQRYLYPEELIKYLSYGLVVFGFLPMMSVFIASPTARMVKRGRRTTAIFSIILFVGASFFGGISRALLYPMDTHESASDYMYAIAFKLFRGDWVSNVLGVGYVTSLILIIVIVSGMLLNVIVGIVSTDLLAPALLKKTRSSEDRHKKEQILIIAVSIFIAGLGAFIACGIRIEVHLIVFGMVAICGIATGPAMILSLYKKRMSGAGLGAGMMTGLMIYLALDSVELIPSAASESGKISIGEYIGIGAVIPAFVISLIVIVIVSRFTYKKDENREIMFDEVKNRIV